MTHTPTPWRVCHLGTTIPGYHVCNRIVCDEFTDRTSSMGPSEEDAAFIVRAVNAYNFLMDFAKGKCPHLCTDGNCPFDRKAKAAIAKAEEVG